jgi:hypothetical protein
MPIIVNNLNTPTIINIDLITSQYNELQDSPLVFLITLHKELLKQKEELYCLNLIDIAKILKYFNSLEETFNEYLPTLNHLIKQIEFLLNNKELLHNEINQYNAENIIKNLIKIKKDLSLLGYTPQIKLIFFDMYIQLLQSLNKSIDLSPEQCVEQYDQLEYNEELERNNEDIDNNQLNINDINNIESNCVLREDIRTKILTLTNN